MAVEEELQSEVTQLAGDDYQHNAKTIKRWGSNRGSVCLGNQKLSIAVPRVRDQATGKEVSLESYRAFQS
ncbi:MAG: IS256 family transposase, partial [Nitrospirota bacterium]